MCIDSSALQESRWYGIKNRDIEHERSQNEYMFFRFGNPCTQCCIAFHISESIRNTVKEMEQFEYSLLNIPLASS